MWLPGDYDAAIAWQTEQNLRCPGCDHPRDEVWVFDPADEPRLTAEFRAQVGKRRCVACRVSYEEQSSWQRELAEMGESQARRLYEHGWHWTFEPPEADRTS